MTRGSFASMCVSPRVFARSCATSDGAVPPSYRTRALSVDRCNAGGILADEIAGARLGHFAAPSPSMQIGLPAEESRTDLQSR